MSRRRVLLVGKGPPERGGIAAFLQLLMASDLTDEFDLRFQNLTRVGEVSRGGRFSGSNLGRTLADFRTVLGVSRAADIVHIHSAFAPLVTMVRAGLLALASRLRGCKVILHVHGGRFNQWGSSRGHRMIARLVLAPVSKVAAVSETAVELLASLMKADRVVYIPNGVDLDRFSPSGDSHSPPRILYVGLLTPRKGVVDLLEASDALDRGGVDHELWIAGGTPDEGPEGEQEVRAALTRRAKLLGPQPYDAMPRLYQQADIFCLPSWWEAMPLSILEAMASGLPVVATKVGEIAGMVQDGVSGLLVESRQPQALAAALKELVTKPQLAHKFGLAARARAEESYNIRQTIAAVRAVYDSLVEAEP